VVSGLVNVSFGMSRRSGTDDAITPAALDMDNVENAIPKRGSNDDHPVGSRTVVKVDGGRVSEDGGSFREGNAVPAEVRQSFLVVPFEIAFDDCRHDIDEYGLRPILGQARLTVRLTYRR
jgi:hypothetical protein